MTERRVNPYEGRFHQRFGIEDVSSSNGKRKWFDSMKRQGLVVEGNFADVKSLRVCEADSQWKDVPVNPEVIKTGRGNNIQEITIFNPVSPDAKPNQK